MQVSTKDLINILIPATIFLVILSGFIVMLVKLFDKTRRNFELEKENLNKDHETQLLQTQLEIQEQTLNNISQEIHDNIGQVLTFVKLSMNAIDLNETEVAKDKLTTSKSLLSKAIQDLRNLSKTLNTSFIKDVGLNKSIELQLGFLNKLEIYEAKFNTSEISYSYPANTEIVLFRITQELLNNIVKHAEAKKINVLLDYGEANLTITISDDGKGFDQSATTNTRSGLGLKNIISRVDMLGGNFSMSSEIGKGTVATIQIPRPAN